MKISYKIGICSDCGKEKTIIHKSLKLCWFCNQYRLAKKYREKRKERVQKGDKADKALLANYYKEIWKTHSHRCFECNEPLFKFHSWHVHHVLHKEDYPQLALKKDVSVLMCLLEHSMWHGIAASDRPKKLPKTFKRYLELLKKYDPDKYREEIVNTKLDI